jgi:hypothetical protein
VDFAHPERVKDFHREIPHHSAFSENPHGRFQESNLFQRILEEIVARYLGAGLVKGEPISVDRSFIPANADHHRRVSREHPRAGCPSKL